LESIKNLKAEIINVDLASLGGSVKHGTKIYNLLKENSATINVNITGWTASMGTVIAMAGDTIKMVDNAYFLIHEARTVSWGVKSQLEADAKFLDAINDTLSDIYAKRIGSTKEAMKELMAVNGGEGVFWTANETLEKGFIDTVYTPEKASRAAASVTSKELKQFKINAKLKQEQMKFNLKEVGKIVKGAFDSAFGTLPKEEQTPENIEALVAKSTELVVEELQKDVDAYKTEQENKYADLEAKYNKLKSGSSEPNGTDANLDGDAKLTAADKAAKEFIGQLSETDKNLMTKPKND
jgi:ATP-dependent protease ClpP protease subunit